MIDLLTLALTHGLILIALWRLLFRDELDVEDARSKLPRPWLRERPERPSRGGGDDA
ncbi:MAG TPA: hypothetical protein VKY80_12920 [Croceibacterium sp.]|nr:hypothetical protein [Croceibacterium sp.]